MDNKKLGLIIIGLSVLFSLLTWGFSSQLSALKTDACACGISCAAHEQSYLIYCGIALIAATLSLGAYLLFFEKSHKLILDKIEKDSSVKNSEERFNLILMGLNADEKKILSAVKEQDGITQHTLGLRTDMHKSKLSVVMGILEHKGLIKKEKKGKTNQIFLRVKL
ncbi:MAG: hypothetical protein Q8O89_01855 [Nanoarchaeota archaeon]|nr:hypothetical protein [Nanoarchaeota archaeon]